jgi:glycosyltransferase involved in cell wall biosynthesis
LLPACAVPVSFFCLFLPCALWILISADINHVIIHNSCGLSWYNPKTSYSDLILNHGAGSLITGFRFRDNKMTKKKNINKSSVKPVVYLHARDRDPFSEPQVNTLLNLGLTLCNRLQIDGVVKTEYGYDQPGSLLTELAGLFPGQAVIFLRAGLQPSGAMIDQLSYLSGQADYPLILSPLSNASSSVNPFAGLEPPAHDWEYDPTALVGLLAPGNLHALTEWADHCAFLSAEAVNLLAGDTLHCNIMQKLLSAGGQFKVADNLFLHDEGKRVFQPLSLAPHESAYPPPFSALSARLHDWFNAEIPVLPPIRVAGKRATLHITHSWGGGVGQWLKSYIESDNHQAHIQLRSELAQSSHAYGQKLCLYAGNELRCPIASWWLQPPIESITQSDPAYKNILDEICHRFEVGRVYISSLIGHSLDALRTGLPTLQILHDHFPLWPLLNANPVPYLVNDGGIDLGKALKEHYKNQTFPDKGVESWSQVNKAYLQAAIQFDVKIAAPGQWVLDLQTRLAPDFLKLKSRVIPHGFPAVPGRAAVNPRPREDGRLRMVVLGRMQESKGQKLLLTALPRLVEHVQVYLLGTGKWGESFFGISGVDVILEYKREELGSLLADIGPDFAALLSVVRNIQLYLIRVAAVSGTHDCNASRKFSGSDFSR